MNTKESHRYALLMHLQSKKLIDTTEMIMTTSAVTSNLFEIVCKIYFQLKHKSYMHSDIAKGCVYFNCTEQLQNGLEEVCMYIHFGVPYGVNTCLVHMYACVCMICDDMFCVTFI